MHKDTINERQAVAVIFSFLLGSAVVIGISSDIGQDSWISLLLSSILSFVMYLIYSRILKLIPCKDIFQIIMQLFGKVAGKIVIAFFSLYQIHLASIVLRNFSEYIEITSMPETPQLSIMIILLVVIAYIAKSGINVLGKWSIIVLTVLIFVISSTTLLLINNMDITEFMPVFNHSYKEIAKSSLMLFSFPFGEIIAFMAIGDAIKKGSSPYKIFIYGQLFSTVMLLAIIFRNISTLGAGLVKAEYFPSFASVRIVKIGDFLSRIEGSISMNFILAGIVKIAVCLIAGIKGIASIFNITDYKKLVVPGTLAVLALCPILYKDIMEMFNFLETYAIYSMPFQVIMPLALWIKAEKLNKSGGLAAILINK